MSGKQTIIFDWAMIYGLNISLYDDLVQRFSQYHSINWPFTNIQYW